MNKQNNYMYKNNIFITKNKGSTHIPVYNTQLNQYSSSGFLHAHLLNEREKRTSA